ncbi:MAG: PDZ domain-containing protein [Acidobacteria bacterium]|nr:PDZ domain-containing protein [Acidobacteriota bacterium]
MQHWFFRLFEKTDRAVLVLAGAVLFLTIAIFPVQAQAQPSASSINQSNQKSETSGAGASLKSSGVMLGVYLGDISEERAKDLKLTEARGALVGNVQENSPAAKAGLQENDVILAFNNQQIFNPAQFHRLLMKASAGSIATLVIHRAGVSQTVRVSLGQRPITQRGSNSNFYATAEAYMQAANERSKEAEDARLRGDEKEARRLEGEAADFRKLSDEARASVDKDISEGRVGTSPSSLRVGNHITAARYQLGVRVSSLNEQLATFFNVKNGVLVNEVRAGGVAESAGVKAGDCIVAVNGERVETLADLNRLVDRVNDKVANEAALSVVRDRTELTINVKFGQR